MTTRSQVELADAIGLISSTYQPEDKDSEHFGNDSGRLLKMEIFKLTIIFKIYIFDYVKRGCCTITPEKGVIVQQEYRNYRLVMYNKIFDVAFIC